ncbi:MAG TPA: class I SAM-dependent methyltransferase [Jiangellaceae bacterium]|nr:class I SAM-dependent methyltransferase [Jiangellaceae bacterium]
MSQAIQANQTEREFWAAEGPQQYVEHGDRWETMMAPFGAAMFDFVALQPGKRVLDVGCGWGATTVEAADRVAPTGSVVGIDFAAQMLARAARRTADLANVTLLEADAQTHPFEPASYDAVISRFAAMLFDDPPAAFANLHRALRPGGRLAFVCWQDPLKTEWVAVAMAAAVPLVGRPPDMGEPGAPGPFAFADGDRVRRLVAAGGFNEVTLEPVTRPQRIADNADDAVAFVRSLPETRQLLNGVPKDTVAKVTGALRDAFTPHAGPHGVVTDATAWLVTARR